MSGVRVLVGTRKGAFVLTSDGKRETWDVSGPHFGGWEIYHVKASPADPNRIYASQSNGWFGQLIQRSDDGGTTWEPVGNQFQYDGVPGTHQWYDGTPHPWEFARVWHLEPSLTDPDTILAGVEDAALFRSTDGGQSWNELAGPPRSRLGTQLAAGGRRHVPAHDHRRSEVTPSGSSWRSPRPASSAPTTAARRWRPTNRGLRSEGIPDADAEVGHCVHRLAMHPSHPDVLYMQKHWDVMRSDDAGDSWDEVSGRPPDRFRLRHRRPCARTGDRLCRADQERLRALPAGRASCVSTGAGAVATSGSRSRRAFRRRTATSTCSAMRWRWTRWTPAGSTSARPEVRSTDQPTRATPGRRSSGTCRLCCRSRCRHCHDPRRAPGAPADSCQRRPGSGARGHRSRPRSDR